MRERERERERESMERSRTERTSPGSQWRLAVVREIAEQPELSAVGDGRWRKMTTVASI
jgi:hypothetical protein